MYLKQFASIKDDEINEIEKKLKVKFKNIKMISNIQNLQVI